jgi:hypothetical protein
LVLGLFLLDLLGSVAEFARLPRPLGNIVFKLLPLGFLLTKNPLLLGASGLRSGVLTLKTGYLFSQVTTGVFLFLQCSLLLVALVG